MNIDFTYEVLNVSIDDAESVDLSISNDNEVNISIEGNEDNLEADIKLEEFDISFTEGTIVQGDRLPNYEGDYEAIPKVTEQTFPTKDRSMVDDFMVLAIPYSSVSNPQGGFTVTIGQ